MCRSDYRLNAGIYGESSQNPAGSDEPLRSPLLQSRRKVPRNHVRSSPYSVRSALMGEIVAARPAGMTAAKKVQPTSDPAATDRAKGSQNDTP